MNQLIPEDFQLISRCEKFLDSIDRQQYSPEERE